MARINGGFSRPRRTACMAGSRKGRRHVRQYRRRQCNARGLYYLHYFMTTYRDILRQAFPAGLRHNRRQRKYRLTPKWYTGSFVAEQFPV